MKIMKILLLSLILSIFYTINASEVIPKNKIVYIANDHSIPYWQIMYKGMRSEALSKNYELEIYDAKNQPKKELELIIKAIKEKAKGIIISPSNSSAAVTLLEIAKNANIPVVISDIGSDGGEYVSYISSNNVAGAYDIGTLLSKKMIEKSWQNGRVGIIAIPQKRLNGQQRTTGFMKALQEKEIKGADIKQIQEWTEEETYNFSKDFILKYPELRAIWLQTSNLYKGAIRAIKELKKEKELFLVTFDAEPEFIDLINDGIIIGSGMQQPYIMGKKSARALINHLNGKKVEKNIQVSILTISTENIKENLIAIEHNVLGIE